MGIQKIGAREPFDQCPVFHHVSHSGRCAGIDHLTAFFFLFGREDSSAALVQETSIRTKRVACVDDGKDYRRSKQIHAISYRSKRFILSKLLYTGCANVSSE